MIDAIKLASSIEKIVARNSERKYYRFRPARFYGGIATADAVGCNLNCAFCWVNKPRKFPGRIGEFYSPGEVVDKLVGIAEVRGYGKLRISGAEPTIGKQHLLEVIDLIPNELLFILETNGILIGYDKSYARELKRENIHVRVAIKGATPEEFSILTSAKPEFFELQLKALENLLENRVSFHAAAMLFTSVEPLVKKLAEIDQRLVQSLEIERFMSFPHVEEEMKQRRILEQIKKLKSRNKYS